MNLRKAPEKMQPDDPDFGTSRHRSSIDTSCLVIGYAMSRMDVSYLESRGVTSWRAAYAEASTQFARPASSFKLLRDEFDPWHGNVRRGWHQRPLRPDRERVLHDLAGVSDAALLVLVDRLLAQDDESTSEAIVALSSPATQTQRVAERLLTGRRAEEYFVEHCREIMDIAPEELLDYRNAASGFDFGVRGIPERAIEVKGLKQQRGEILFTDREWHEARLRRHNYWVVLVGRLATQPLAKVVQDPFATLRAECRYDTVVVASWRANLDVCR